MEERSRQVPLALLGAALAAVVLAGLLLVPVAYRGKIYPGVRVGAVDVGGLSPDDAAIVVREPLEALAAAKQVTLVDPGSGRILEPGHTVAQEGVQPGAHLQLRPRAVQGG